MSAPVTPSARPESATSSGGAPCPTCSAVSAASAAPALTGAKVTSTPTLSAGARTTGRPAWDTARKFAAPSPASATSLSVTGSVWRLVKKTVCGAPLSPSLDWA